MTDSVPGMAMPKKNSHTRPKAPSFPLDQPGRLRVANLLCLLNISHSKLYDGLKAGKYPKPDGFDGRNPYWRTASILPLL